MTMMKCGHSANGKRKIGNIWTDCCLICIGLDPKAKIIDEAPPDLNERKARCSYFDSIPKGRNHESNYGCRRGIFLKTKLLSEDLTVDIGNRTFVKKSIPEAQELIKEQLVKLNEVKGELNYSLDKVGEEMMKIMEEGKK